MGGANPPLGVVMQMLSNNGQSGGRAGLAKAFQDKGMGDQMTSWISTGQNQPISPEQIKAVPGGGQLGQIALAWDERATGCKRVG